MSERQSSSHKEDRYRVRKESRNSRDRDGSSNHRRHQSSRDDDRMNRGSRRDHKDRERSDRYRSHGEHEHRSRHRNSHLDSHRDSHKESHRDHHRDRHHRIHKAPEIVLKDEHGSWYIEHEARQRSRITEDPHNRLNKLKADILKAEMRNDPELETLKKQYKQLADDLAGNQADSNSADTTEKIHIIDQSMQKLASVKASNEESNIHEMVQEEIASRARGDRMDMKMAEQIGRDRGYQHEEDYLTENAERMSKISQKTETNLRNQLLNDSKKIEEAVSRCALCLSDEKEAKATVVSSATRVYMCLAPDPPIAKGTVCIVPFEHYTNTLECDDDEWEEIRNYMKALSRMWYALNRGVIFYENAVSRSHKSHAVIFAVPVPLSLQKSAAGFFSEAMNTADDEWASHRKVIDTRKKAEEMEPEYAKYAFRVSIAKEAPYFHVWLNINGGMGHIVENTSKWPPGDRFAREVIGGMLQADPVLIRKYGSWLPSDPGKPIFEKYWKKFDWTLQQ